MGKIKVTQKQKLLVIISAVTSSVAVVAVTILIVERKLFSDFLSDLHKQIDEFEKIVFEQPPREEQPKANDFKLNERLKDEELLRFMRDIDIPNRAEKINISRVSLKYRRKANDYMQKILSLHNLKNDEQ